MAVRTLRQLVRSGALCAALAAAATTGCQTSGTDTQGGAPAATGSEFDQGPVDQGMDSSVAIAQLETIYFAYDRAELTAEARAKLKTNADAIRANTGWGTVTVQGHCDERGTEEYNIALGQRRAEAVKRYLVDLGVSSGRLRTVSFGEAKPAVMGHDESAWRFNRRANFAGG